MNRMPAAVRPYTPADEAAVLDLLHLSLGDGRAFQRDHAFWQWKHFHNPFGASLLMVAADAGIVGLRAFLRWEFRTDTRVLTAVRAVDTATHPEHRRSGIFSHLTRITVDRARGEGVDLIFNTPNQYSLPGYLKLGWTHVGRPGLLIRPLRPPWRLGAFRRDRDALPSLADEHGALSVVALLAEASALERLLADNERLCRGRLRTRRSAAFLRWRYTEIPSLRYYACWTGPVPSRAVAIFRPNLRRGWREIMLADLLLAEPDPRPVRVLMRRLAALGAADYAVAHAPWGSGHWRSLVGAGFLPVPRLGPHFTVCPLSAAAGAEAPTRLPRWHLSLGDLEIF